MTGCAGTSAITRSGCLWWPFAFPLPFVSGAAGAMGAGWGAGAGAVVLTADAVRVTGAAMTTGAVVAVAVVVATTDAGGSTGAGGVTRRITIGRGFGRRVTTGAAGWSTSGVTTIGAVGAKCGVGSASARTMAGCAAADGKAKEGVSPPAGPAKNRGNATVPATAPASNTVTTTPRVIAIMVPTPDADGITRTRYRQVGTRA